MARLTTALLLMALACHSLVAPGWAGDLTHSRGDGLTDRDHEARAILQEILAQSDRPETCEYDIQWWKQARLPGDIAKEEFGITIDADLVPPYNTGDFRTVVNPNKTIPEEMFCDSAYVDERARSKLERSAEKESAFVTRNRTLYGYPIFNAKKTKAVVMITHTDLPIWRNKDKIGEGPIVMDEGAIVFQKVKGRWKKTKFHSLGMS